MIGSTESMPSESEPEILLSLKSDNLGLENSSAAAAARTIMVR